MSVRPWVVAATVTALAVTGQAVLPVAPAPAVQAAAVAASQTRTWEPVKRLGDSPWGEALVADARNHTTVVWTTSSTPPAIVALRRSADGHWGKQVVVGHGYAPRVAADARGNVTAVWTTRRAGFTDGVVAARRPAGGRWSAPVRLSRDLSVPGYPHGGEEAYGAVDLDLAVSPGGDAVVAWAWGSDAREKPWRIQSAFRPRGGPWKEPTDVTPASGADRPKVGIDARGTVVLVYGRQLLGHPQVLKARRRVPGVGWTKPTTVATEGYGHAVAVDRVGDAVVVFTPDFATVQAVYRPAAGRWGAAESLSPAGAEVNDYALAMNGPGTAVVALGRGSGRVDLVERPPDGPWSKPARVVPPGSQVSDVVVALNGAGDTFLGWGVHALYGSYRPHGGAWSDPVTVSPDAGVEVLEETFAQVAADGDAVVLWKQEARPLKVRVMTAS